MKKKIVIIILGLMLALGAGLLIACTNGGNDGNGPPPQEGKVRVTFDLQGGTGDFPFQDIDEGATITRPTTDPTRAGYSFVNWFTAQTGGEIFNFASPITSNTTIYARWRQDTQPVEQFTVTFNTLGGSAISSQIIDEGSTATRPATNPTRTGYSFIDWYTAQTGGEIFNFASPTTTNTTIFARWRQDTQPVEQFTVTFNTLGGSAISSQIIDEGSTATRPTTDPTRADYTFVNWFTAETGGEEFNFNAPITGDKTVFARWQSMQPHITSSEGFTFYNNEAFISVPNAVETFSFFDRITVSTDSSWILSRDRLGEFPIVTRVISLSEPGNRVVYIIVHREDLFKVYQVTVRRRPIYTVVFDANGGTGGVVEQQVEEGYFAMPPQTTRDVFEFSGWGFDFDKPIYESKTVSAIWRLRYIDAEGELVSVEENIVVLEAGNITLTTGWYALIGTVSGNYEITIEGEVNLILADRSNWTLAGHRASIVVTNGNKLNIFSQSMSAIMGRLSVNENIGGNFFNTGSLACRDGGEITINGGTITARSIGGGAGFRQVGGAGGEITINGGTVTVTHIGGGAGSGSGGVINISGGTITATSIGGGSGGDVSDRGGAGGEITIKGGTVTVTHIGGGAGSAPTSIWSNSPGGAGGIIRIEGGIVAATTIGGGAGRTGRRLHIDDSTPVGGHGGAAGEIIINGGIVAATHIGGGIGGDGADGRDGAAWSGGRGGVGGAGGVINISGGTITATSIGGGNGGNGGHGGSDFSWIVGRLGGVGGNGGSGGAGGAINISGGTITATSIGSGNGGSGGAGGLGRNSQGNSTIASRGSTGQAGANALATITGGSVRTELSRGIPTNGETNGNQDLQIVVIETGRVEAKVYSVRIIGAEYYSIAGITTNEEGRFYLWLPADAIVEEVIIDGTNVI